MSGLSVAKHYSYRLDHDTGFAPHVSDGVCTLCGCKSTSIERWARPGSWIVGIGGSRTGKPDTLIYAMEVEATPSLAELRRQSTGLAAYLRGRSLKPSARVLVSRHFYYFGGSAVAVPPRLQSLLIRRQGCKRLADGDIAQLAAYLAESFATGVHGIPNNRPSQVMAKCGCGRYKQGRLDDL